MSNSKSSGGSGISVVLARFIAKVPDIRYIAISTPDGIELLAEMRQGVTADDGQLVSTLVPSFTVSTEQASRLNMGMSVHSLTWASGYIFLQLIIESLVLTVVMEETANIGIMEEHLSPLQAILRPFCAGFSIDVN